MDRLRLAHLLLALVIFCVELVIAFTLDRGILRTWGGDVLVVMLMYFFLRGILRSPPLHTAIGVLLFAFVIEFSQYLGLIHYLGLADQLWARLLMGDTYEATDLLAYTLGVGLALLLDMLMMRVGGVEARA